MPMIDLTVPRGALSDEATAELMAALSRTNNPSRSYSPVSAISFLSM